mmetsp:Transcript_814/g.2206  ORF Transcript_814/g.2206 Transcript_814/m.2206 type:complete len:279 (+) Transcript_814:1764-2600(+)
MMLLDAISSPRASMMASALLWTTFPSVISRMMDGGSLPRRMLSTDSATLGWMFQWSLSIISTTTSNVGGALRSNTLFCTPLRRLSSSPKVTDEMLPTTSFSDGFLMIFSRTLPCAVAMSWTPRCEMVRAARLSSTVPISSMMMTFGVWFSTASIITRCCCDVLATCMRRDRPIPTCATSPSPPISLLVSTITTLRNASSARMREISRIAVVFPTPGRPSNSTECPSSTISLTISALPSTASPTRQVMPTIFPARFLMAEIRCSVPSMPDRLSSAKSEQ